MNDFMSLILGLLLTLSVTHAQDHDPIDSFDEEVTISIREVEPSRAALELQAHALLRSLTVAQIGNIITVADRLVALGTKVWDIIVKGKANIELTFADPISVLAKDNVDQSYAFYEMEEWSMPVVKTFSVEARSRRSGRVQGTFKYNIVYQAGGRVNGTGRYLTGLYINASEIVGRWGSSLAATSELMSIANIGTSEEPIATATMRLEYTYSALRKVVKKSRLFYITGEGDFVTLL